MLLHITTSSAQNFGLGLLLFAAYFTVACAWVYVQKLRKGDPFNEGQKKL